MDGLEIFSWDGEHYKTLVSYGAWRVAMLNHGVKFVKATYLERHLKTDEVFVLLEGEATLIIGAEMARVPMEKYKAYNVKAGQWHQIETVPGTRCLIVENASTGKDNSDYMEL